MQNNKITWSNAQNATLKACPEGFISRKNCNCWLNWHNLIDDLVRSELQSALLKRLWPALERPPRQWCCAINPYDVVIAVVTLREASQGHPFLQLCALLVWGQQCDDVTQSHRCDFWFLSHEVGHWGTNGWSTKHGPLSSSIAISGLVSPWLLQTKIRNHWPHKWWPSNKVV